MSKLIDPKDYIKLSSYAKNYSVCKRKLYRYIKDESIDYVIIDDVHFIKDIQYISLKVDHRTKEANDIVTTMTLDSKNHGKLISETTQVPDFKEDSNVTTMTKDNVKGMTLKNRLKELLKIPENERSIIVFEEIKEIKEKFKII